MDKEHNYDQLNSFYSKLWWNLAQFFPEDRALEVNPGGWPELAPAIHQLSALREVTDRSAWLKRQPLQPELKERIQAQYSILAKNTTARIQVELNKLEEDAKDWEDNFSEQIKKAKKDAQQTIEKIEQFGQLGSDISDWQVATQELKEKLAERALEYVEHVYADGTLWEG